MKYFKINLPLIGLLFLFSNSNCFASFAGIYTIDASKAASYSNYKNIKSAVNDLEGNGRTDGGSANGKGVTGAVTFNIANGTYNEQIDILSVAGFSSSKPIVFQSASGDSSKVILTLTTVSGLTYRTILIFGSCKNIVFNQLTFSGDDPLYDLVEVGSANHHIVFTDCRFITASNINIITSVSTYNSDLQVLNSHFVGGIYGVYITTGNNNNFTVSHNVFDFLYYPVYMYNVDTITILANKISISIGYHDCAAILVYYCIGNNLVKNNQIIFHNVTNGSYSSVRGLDIENSSNVLAANNMISMLMGSNSGGVYGIYVLSNQKASIVYNTVLIDSGSGGGTASMYVENYGSGNTKIFNNNLVNKVGGYSMEFSSIINTSDTCDYNNLIGGSQLVDWNGKSYATLALYKAGVRFDQHSVSISQTFINDRNLHTKIVTLYGKGLVFKAVTDDIDGETRSKYRPCIGADESVLSNDLSTIKVLPSKTSFCTYKGITLKAVIQNLGTAKVDSYHMFADITGPVNDQVIVANVDPIGSSFSDTFLISNNLVFTSPGTYKIKVYCSIDNNKDQFLLNDTLTISVTAISPPVPNFNVAAPCVKSTATFTNATTNTDTKTSYYWDFGDGVNSTLISPTHVFYYVQTYKVLLTATKSGCSDTFSERITPHPLPVSDYTYVSDLYTVDFSAVNASYSSYTWEFGDGAISNLVRPSHPYIFSDNLNFKTTLITKSQYGCIDSTSKKIYLTNSGIANHAGAIAGFSTFPNPFSDHFEIQYHLDNESQVSVKLYDLQSRLIKQIVDEKQVNGNYDYLTNSSALGLNPGVYYVQIECNGNSKMQKVIYLK